jgi:hypothetical protein
MLIEIVEVHKQIEACLHPRRIDKSDPRKGRPKVTYTINPKT